MKSEFFKINNLLIDTYARLSEFIVQELEKNAIFDLNYNIINFIYTVGSSNKKMSVSSFKKKTRLDKKNIYYFVNVAYARGYVEKQSQELDKRECLIVLTEKGQKVFKIIEEILSLLSHEQLENTYTCL